MAGALSGGADDDGQSTLNDYMMMQAMAGGATPGAAAQQKARTATGGGASSSPAASTGGALTAAMGGDNISGGAAPAQGGSTPLELNSPQEWRDLQLLESARGLMNSPHTGRLEEGVGNMYTNLADVQQKHMAMNAAAKAKLAEIQANMDAKKEISEGQNQSREDIANIMVGKNAMTNLTPDEIKEAGLAPGTVAQRNRFGNVHVVQSPPASQRVLTGYDNNGQAQYADPGAALTPKLRSDYQEYLRQSNQAVPQLENMMNTLQPPDGSAGPQSALGVSGLGERAARGSIGQAANLMGKRDVIAPDDATVRTKMEQLNALLRPTLLADPRAQSAHLTAKDINDMLPDPDSWTGSIDDAMTKYGAVHDAITKRQGEYSDILTGKTQITDQGSGKAKGGGSDATLQHAKDAIAAGADPAKVKARLKEMGVDASGL